MVFGPGQGREGARVVEWTTILPYAIPAGEWAIRLALIPIVIRRHAQAQALAWMAFVFFVPYVGLVVYLLLGLGPMARRRMRAQRHAIETIETAARLEHLRPFVVPTQRIEPHRRDLVRLAERLGQMPIVEGNEAELLAEAEAMVERLIADIEAAQETVHLLYYIYRDDATGQRVGEALASAAGRGVRCRVLVDAVGSRGMLGSLAPRLRARGVEVRAMLPVRLLRSRLARIDMRNHRKLAVVDGQIAYTGSQNIADPGYGHRRCGPWRDLSVRARGPIVWQIQLVFLESWYLETGQIPDEEPGVRPEPARCGTVVMQCVPSGPGHRAEAFRGLLVDAVHEADRRVIMTTPYLVPDESLVQALRLSALGGVQVDVVVPERGNHPLVNAAARAYFDELSEAGVRLHLHRRGLLHAKTLTVDDSFAMIGSGNFDMRSFTLNFELSVLLFGAPMTRRLRAQQETYIAESRPLDVEAWRQRSGLRQMADHTAKLFAPVL